MTRLSALAPYLHRNRNTIHTETFKAFPKDEYAQDIAAARDTDSYNTTTGFQALYRNTTTLGFQALAANTMDILNIAVGINALLKNVTCRTTPRWEPT